MGRLFEAAHGALPVGMVGEELAGMGTVMHAETVRRYAEETGFDDFEIPAYRERLLAVVPFEA